MMDVLAQTGLELFGLSVPLLLVVLGAGLMIMEAFAPGAHFIVIGIALFAAGLVGLGLSSFGFPTALLLLVVAGVVVAAGATALYGYRQFDFYGGKGSGRTSRPVTRLVTRPVWPRSDPESDVRPLPFPP